MAFISRFLSHEGRARTRSQTTLLFTNEIEVAIHRAAMDGRIPGIVRRALLVVTPIALLTLAGLDVVVRGWNAVATVATNLPAPPYSLGKRVVDLTHPTSPHGRVHRIRLVRSTTPETRLDGARVQLELATGGTSRLLLVEQGGADASRPRGLLSALRGRATLALVDDRGWVDLGPLPADGAPLDVQVVGLLPGPFAFAELDTPESLAFERIDVTLMASDGRVVTTALRYRVVRDAPVVARETLARVGFFVTTSRVALACAVLAIVGLGVGWTRVAGAHAWTGIALLVSSVTLLHAALLPPLQGADESSQVGTIEWVVSDPSPSRAWRFPESIALVGQALEQDRVQFNSGEPLPIANPGARARLRELLESRLATERLRAGTLPPAAGLQVVTWRAPLFYAAYGPFAGIFARMRVGDRIFAYRVAATVSGLVGFAAGLVLLRWARLPAEVAIVYGLTFLMPYVVATSATCSNYAPAIGLGFLVAAALVVAILGPEGRARWTGATVALATAWAGVPIWPDMLGVAALASAVTFASMGRRLLRPPPTEPRLAGSPSGVQRLLGAALVAAAVLVAWWNAPGLDARLAAAGGAWDDSQALLVRAGLIAGPFLLALFVRGARQRLGAGSLDRHRRASIVAAAALALMFAVMFVRTPYAEVPYEQVFLPLTDLVRAHWASFWASSFSYDQDRLGWKFFFGAFGWHDAFYPEAVYALARWAFVALLVALPVLTIEFAHRRPKDAGLLVLVSGAALSLSAASLIVRHAMSVHPHGRFVLPYLPLVALPILVQLATPARHRTLILAVRCGVALDVWAAVAVLGARYAIPG